MYSFIKNVQTLSFMLTLNMWVNEWTNIKKKYQQIIVTFNATI